MTGMLEPSQIRELVHMVSRYAQGRNCFAARGEEGWADPSEEVFFAFPNRLPKVRTTDEFLMLVLSHENMAVFKNAGVSPATAILVALAMIEQWPNPNESESILAPVYHCFEVQNEEDSNPEMQNGDEDDGPIEYLASSLWRDVALHMKAEGTLPTVEQIDDLACFIPDPDEIDKIAIERVKFRLTEWPPLKA